MEHGDNYDVFHVLVVGLHKVFYGYGVVRFLSFIVSRSKMHRNLRYVGYSVVAGCTVVAFLKDSLNELYDKGSLKSFSSCRSYGGNRIVFYIGLEVNGNGLTEEIMRINVI